MCENCGINHETSELEDKDAFDAFVGRLAGMISVTDRMAEYRTEPDVTLTGDPEFGENWKLAVAKLGGTSDVNKVYEVGEMWIVNTYRGDVLTESIVVESIEPQSTQKVAEAFATHRYDYQV